MHQLLFSYLDVLFFHPLTHVDASNSPNMEDLSQTSQLPSQPDETEMAVSSNDEGNAVGGESEPSEPKVAVDGVEDIVSSTSGFGDQEDGRKAANEDTSLDEKPPSPISPKLTSRIAVWLEDHEVDQRIIDIIYWKDVKKTAIIFGVKLLVLLFLVYHTALSVVAFFALSVLTVSLLYRIGMMVIGAVQKTGTGSPYKSLLEKDRAISKERARDIGEMVGARLNCMISKLTRLFLVEEIFASLKFGIFLWILSCVGKYFSAITLLIAATVIAFSVPKLYEEHQVKVDKFLCQVCQKTSEIVQKVKTKVESRFKKNKSE